MNARRLPRAFLICVPTVSLGVLRHRSVKTGMPERQAGLMIQLQPNLPPELFARIDPMNDDAVYSVSIFVTHIDQ